MPTTRTDNTFQEALMKMLRSLADMKVLPDADLEWVLGIEMQVVQKLREPIDVMEMQGTTGVPGMPPLSGPMGPMMDQGMGMPPMPMGPPPGGPMMGGGGVPGIRNEAPMPNPDELRRLLTQG